MIEQLSSRDARYLYQEDENNYAHVSTVNIYDPATSELGRFDFDELVEHLKTRTHVSPVFVRKLKRVLLDLDNPYWVNEDYFELESHISYSRLAAPGNWQQLTKHISRYHSKPLDRSRPLWDMLVIDGLDAIDTMPKGCFAVVTKIHHASTDSTAAMRFFNAFVDLDAEGTPATDLGISRDTGGDNPTPRRMLYRAIKHSVKQPISFTRQLAKAVPKLVELTNPFKQGNNRFFVPDTRFNSEITTQKTFEAITLSLNDLKTIKKAVHGCKLNDVILNVIAGGLRQYLQHHNELPSQPLVAWVPVSLNDSEQQTISNAISPITTQLHTNIENPLARLSAIVHSNKAALLNRNGTPAELMTDIHQHIPGSSLATASRYILNNSPLRLSNVHISNVPGPQQPLYLYGSQCIRQFALGPLANGMALYISTPSYNGMLSIDITSTQEVIPDIECLKQSIINSFETLKLNATQIAEQQQAETKTQTPTLKEVC